jgi:hypothetical protein
LALGWGFTQKNFRKSTQWGLDPQESFAKMDEDGGVEDTIGVEIEVLNTVVLQEPLEEVARWESQPALHEPREHRDLMQIFLH